MLAKPEQSAHEPANAAEDSGKRQSTPSPLPRWCYLLYYHRPGQLVRRLRNVLRNRWLKKFAAASYARPLEELPKLRNNYAFDRLLEAKLIERRLHSGQRNARRIVNREFNFLQHTITFPQKIDWRLKDHSDVDALWRFHFHYHEFLLDLAAADQQSDSFDFTAHAWQIVLDWIENNSPKSNHVFADAWHPFCISRRLPVWLLLWSADPPQANQRSQILQSLVAQARFLADHLETDLGGNHLLENLHALGLVACFLEGPDADRFLEILKQRLPDEIEEQITPHGEHFERSPMYHAFMLEIMLNLRDALTTVDVGLASLATETAYRMGNFLRTIAHPRGDIPLLSDSSLDSAPPASLLLDRLKSLPGKENDSPLPAMQLGGYWAFRSNNDFLLFDAAPACPDHLPAHAHADLLNVVASVAGHRLFVDTGVFDYAAGQMRNFCRGTSSHNVLQIDDADQFDLWSRFRMGYRGWPSTLVAGQQKGFQWAEATHNAYRRLKVPTVGRILACRPQGPWLCLDWADGRGYHRLTGRLHLHPQIQVTQSGEQLFDLQISDRKFQLQILGPAEASIQSGWYCPNLGERQATKVISWHLEDKLPATLGWALLWPDQEGSAKLLVEENSQPTLTWYEKENVVRWTPTR